MTYTQEDISKIGLTDNWLLVQFSTYDYISQLAVLKSGFAVSKRFDPYKFSVISGVVAKVCSNLFYLDSKGEEAEAPLEYDTELEIEVGDEIYFNFLSCQKAVENGRVLQDGGKHYIFLRYDRVYVIIREGKWVGCNGWKIIQPTGAKQAQGTFVVAGKEKNEGKVIGSGKKVRHYWDKKYIETGFIETGDVVRYLHATPIENPILKVNDINFLRIQERDVLCKGDYEMNPYTFHVKPIENKGKSEFKLRGQLVQRGIVLHCPEKWGVVGEEVLYHKENEVVESGDHFVTRISDIAYVNGEKLLINF